MSAKGSSLGRPLVTGNCLKCNKIVTAKYKSTLTKFCGPECHFAWRSELHSGKGNPNADKNFLGKACGYCGKKFYPRNGRQAAVYCNMQCLAKSFSARTLSKPPYQTAYKRTDIGDFVFRSSWEANYARLLNHWGKSWRYESKRFEFPNQRRRPYSYTPDFYLPETDTYVEIKGYEKPIDRTKLRLMKKHYPDVKLSYIPKDIYFQIEKDWAHLVPNWENDIPAQLKQIEMRRNIAERYLAAGIISTLNQPLLKYIKYVYGDENI